MNKEEMIKKVTKDKLKNISVTKAFLKNKLDLPKYLKFGFEIEALIDDQILQNDMWKYYDLDFFNNEGFKGISEAIQFDDDVGDYGPSEHYIGGEIVTPILKDTEETWQDIKKVCEYLKLKAQCTETCSVHTNIGAQALGSNYKNWYNFLKIIAACEPEIYRYLENGEKIRSGAIRGVSKNKYAMPVAQHIRKGLEKSNKNNVNNINELINNCSFNGDYEYKKDKSISLKGIYKSKNEIIPENELDEEKYGRRIEFRMANGTFSPEEIQTQIYIIAKIIELSRNLSYEKNKKLDELLKKELPANYNEELKIDRILDVANILFDKKEDKLQFLFTLTNRNENKEIITDKEELLKLIKKENMVLEFASEELRADKDVILEAVKHGGAQIQYASEEIKSDKEIALIAVKKYGKALQYLSKELREDKEVVLEAIKNNVYALKFASEQVKNDRQVIFEVAKRNKKALKYVDENILFDKDLFCKLYEDIKIIDQYFNSNQIEDEKEFAQCLEEDEILYKYFLNEAIEGNSKIENIILEVLHNLKNKTDSTKDRWRKKILKEKYNKFVMEIFNDNRKEKKCKLAFKVAELDKSFLDYLTQEEQNNKEIVLMVIKEKPNYYKKLSGNLKADKEVVLEVVKKDGELLKYVSEESKNDKEIVLEAVKQNGNALEYASKELRKDREIVLQAVKQNGILIRLVSEDLRNDKEVVLDAIKQNGSALEFASEELKNDKEVILEAVKKDGLMFEFASEELRNDREVVLDAIKQNGSALEFASEELKNNKEVALEAVKKNGYLLYYVSEELRNNKEVVMEAIKKNGNALEYASKELRKDREIVLQAVKQNRNSLRYASEEYQKCFEYEVEL